MSLSLACAPNRQPGPRAVGSRTISLAAATPAGAPLTVELWYPTDASAPEVPHVSQGGFKALAARDAPFALSARTPWLVLSHARGGTRFDLLWLAEALAAHGYVVPAVNHTAPSGGADPLQQRVAELQAAANGVLAQTVLADKLDANALHLGGFSLGGAAALHWAAQSHALVPGGARSALPLRGIVALAPGSGVRFPQPTLAQLGTPVLIVSGSGDFFVDEEHNAAYFAAHLPHRIWHSIPKAGHFAFAPLCTWYGRLRVPHLCNDGWGVSRRNVHAITERAVLDFLADPGKATMHPV